MCTMSGGNANAKQIVATSSCHGVLRIMKYRAESWVLEAVKRPLPADADGLLTEDAAGPVLEDGEQLLTSDQRLARGTR